LIQIKVARRPKASAEAAVFSAWSITMMDIVMLAIAFVFFALSIGYVYGCDRL